MRSTRMLAVLAAALLALASAGCGDKAEPEMDAGADTDADTDSDTDADTETPYECTAEEIAAQNEAVRAALAAEVPCFSGWILDGGDDVTAYYNAANQAPGLVACEDVTANEAVATAMQEAAVAALAGVEMPCQSNTTTVAGGSAADIEALRAAIAALTEPADPGPDAGVDAGVDAGTVAPPPCAVDGLDDPLFVAVVDAEGALADVHPAAGDDSAATAAYATCLAGELAGLALPCLATMEICSEW